MRDTQPTETREGQKETGMKRLHGMTDGQKELLTSLKSREETEVSGNWFDGLDLKETVTGIPVETMYRSYFDTNVVKGTLVSPSVVVRGLHKRGLIEIVGMDYSNPKFNRFVVRLVK